MITEEKISQYLIDDGIRPNLRGFALLKTALLFVLDDPSYLRQITKRLYPAVAKLIDTTSSRAERAIRHALAGKNITNSLYIALACEKLKNIDAKEVKNIEVKEDDPNNEHD